MLLRPHQFFPPIQYLLQSTSITVKTTEFRHLLRVILESVIVSYKYLRSQNAENLLGNEVERLLVLI